MTKTIVGMFVALSLLIVATAEAEIVNALSGLKWEKRVVLVINPAEAATIRDQDR